MDHKLVLKSMCFRFYDQNVCSCNALTGYQYMYVYAVCLTSFMCSFTVGNQRLEKNSAATT